MGTHLYTPLTFCGARLGLVHTQSVPASARPLAALQVQVLESALCRVWEEKIWSGRLWGMRAV